MTELRSSGRLLDVGNTKITGLGIDEVFEGTWYNSLGYSSVLIQIITDQDSATDGLEVQARYSLTPTLIHTHAYTVTANASNGGSHFEDELTGDQYRIVYTNGGVATSSFTLVSTPARTSPGIHMHSLDHSFSGNHPAQLNRSVISGEQPDGIYGNVKISEHNGLYTHTEAHDDPETSIHLVNATGITDVLAIAVVKGGRVIQVNNGAQWSVGNKLKIEDGEDSEYDLLTIKAISTNDLTLDRVLDLGHDASTDVVGYTPDMAVDGSSTPVTFSYTPKNGDFVHVHSIHVTIGGDAEPGLEKFGSQAALTNGVHFRVANTTGRDDTYWIPFRSLNSMVLSGFSFSKIEKVGVAGVWFSTLALNLMEDSNSIISLTGPDQTLEVIIQDDNTVLNTSMEVKIALHKEYQSV